MATPSDRDLLRSIYRRLDLEGLLEDHPDLTQEKIVDLFRRLNAALESPAKEPEAKELPRRREPASTAAQPSGHAGKLILCTDGGSRGNPGPAGFGVVVQDESGGVVREISEFIGQATCNEAEYGGLIAGLEAARDLGAREVLIRSDSELLVRQISGHYKVRSRRLMPLFLSARKLLEEFASWKAQHVPREMNSRADALANEAMDRGK